LTGYFAVLSPQPPAPSISYLSANSGLRGQTFSINISGQYTHWTSVPGATRIDFGDPFASGITVNSFQVTSPTTARVNISIAANAAFGSRVLTIAADTSSGTEVVQTTFTVLQETPALVLVDPGAGMQGAMLTVNVLGQYTGFNNTTVFDFGAGIVVNST